MRETLGERQALGQALLARNLSLEMERDGEAGSPQRVVLVDQASGRRTRLDDGTQSQGEEEGESECH